MWAIGIDRLSRHDHKARLALIAQVHDLSIFSGVGLIAIVPATKRRRSVDREYIADVCIAAVKARLLLRITTEDHM